MPSSFLIDLALVVGAVFWMSIADAQHKRMLQTNTSIDECGYRLEMAPNKTKVLTNMKGRKKKDNA